MLSDLQLKIIEVFSIIDHFRQDLFGKFKNILSILNSKQDGITKRKKNTQIRNNVIDIKKETSKYFDCLDGLRNRMEDEIAQIQILNKKINRAERSLRRLRSLANKVGDLKASTAMKELEDIKNEFYNLEKYIQKHLIRGQIQD